MAEVRSGRSVLVLVVTYNSAAVIEACLRALPAALEGVQLAGIRVVDNGSADGTPEIARAASPEAEVIDSGGNIGYAAAINRGMSGAPDHDYLLILNPDTAATPGVVRSLIDELPAGCGIAVPRIEDPDGGLALSLRHEPSLRTALGEAVLGGGRAGRLGWGEVITDPACYARAGAVDWATGAVALVTRDCEVTLGRWREDFLLYSEETDYMLRARDAGMCTWYVPEAVVSHRGGESGTSPFLWSLLMVNRARLYRLRHGAISGFLYRMVLLAGEAARSVTGRKRSRAAVRLLARPSLAPRTLPG